MKVAVPVKDETLQFFGNAGHTPFFAVYTIKGAGMFRAFELEALRKNPRGDLDHDHADEDHHCDHDDNDEAHIREHFKMGEALEDCDFIVVNRACKNTAAAMAEYGVHIRKYAGESAKADAVLRSVSAQLA